MRSLLKVILTIASMTPCGAEAEEGKMSILDDDCSVEFYDSVSVSSMSKLVSQLKEKALVCDETLVVIETGGGDNRAFNYYKYDLEGFNLHTHIRGRAASMGVPLYLVGDVRTIDPNAYLMLHQTQTTLGTGDYTAHALMLYAKEAQLGQDVYDQYVAKRSGTSKAKVRGMVEQETILYATDAISLGFAHRIALTN